MKLPRFFRTLTDNNCTPEWLMVVAAMHICLDSDGVVPSEVLRRWEGAGKYLRVLEGDPKTGHHQV